MKIAYLCADRGIPIGGRKGGSVHVQSIVRALRAHGHEVRMVAASAAPGRDDDDEIDLAEATALLQTIDDGSEPRVGRALAHVLTNAAVYDVLTTTLSRWRADVVYERLSPFGFAGSVVAERLGLPHVIEVNALLAEEGARFRRQALGEAATYLEHRALRRASAAVVVSRALAARLCEIGVAADRVFVLPNGVDDALFAADGPAAPGVPRDRTVVGFVGSLKPWHGVDVLLEAFEPLVAAGRHHLLVVGDGPAARAVRLFAGRHAEQVTWIRDIAHHEVPAYVRAIDIAVAPYPPIEPFYFSPLKVLEYMAAGRAVIASRVGQLTELIRHEDTGLLVAPGDAGALAAAIRRLTHDASQREEMGRRAAMEIRARHLWSHRAADLTGFLHTVLGPGRPWQIAPLGA